MLAACVDSNIDDGMNIDGSTPSQVLTQKPVTVFSAEQAIPGEIIVKFRESVADSLEAAGSLSAEGSVVSGVQSIDRFNESVGAFRMERVFPDAGRFEARSRKMGMHLWYKIEFDKSVSMSKVGQMLASVPELSVVEYNVQIKLIDGDVTPVSAQDAVASTSSIDWPFNDPNINRQWHYQNDGTLFQEAIAGADINVVEAWKKCTGSKDVIVAVVDGGVDYSHPDLKDNIWINEAEMNGTDNVDDDGNGYRDDIYGFDFYNNKGGSFVPYPHGTHIGGTISAVNNNGVGVAGIAGGSGAGDGTRLMSCAIFDGTTGAGSGADVAAKAIKYGADNGAVISQNSWGFTNPYIDWSSSQFSSLRAAIDYFISYAGMDETGEIQVGPMAGGLVVFAAGNDGYIYGTAKFYPPAYDKVLSVAAMAADYTPAYYTCYGDWVDVTAPGGDASFVNYNFGAVYSTTTNRGYAYMNGTSMACPHVSGIAALAVAYANQLGVPLAANDLKLIIEQSTHNFDEYMTGRKAGTDNTGYSFNLNMADYKGLMGTGYVDAALVLSNIEGIIPPPDDHVNPQPIDGFTQIETNTGSVTIQWDVTADYAGNPAKAYRVYWSESAITLSGIEPKVDASVSGPIVVTVGDKAVGDKIGCEITGLMPETQYNVAIVTVDKWSKVSEQYDGTVRTDDKVPPVAVSGLRATDIQYTSIDIEWTASVDCIGAAIPKYRVAYSVSEDMSGAQSFTVTGKSAGATMTSSIKSLAYGTTYYITVTAIDQWEMSSDASKIAVTTKMNLPPVVTATQGTELVAQYWSSASLRFDVEEPNGDAWSAKVVGDTDGLLQLSTGDGYVIITLNGDKLHTDRVYDAQLVVSDAEGLAADPVDFTFKIIGNIAPVAAEIPNVYMGSTGLTQTYTLDDYFSDANGEPLVYDVAIIGNTAVAQIDNGTLLVSGQKYGLVTVTVTARDAAGAVAESTFKVMVRDNSKEIEVYPNPVVNDMNVRMGQGVSGTIAVRIYSAAGPLALETTAAIDTFAPAKIDVSSLAAGNYVVEVTYGGKVYKSAIVKK